MRTERRRLSRPKSDRCTGEARCSEVCFQRYRVVGKVGVLNFRPRSIWSCSCIGRGHRRERAVSGYRVLIQRWCWGSCRLVVLRTFAPDRVRAQL